MTENARTPIGAGAGAGAGADAGVGVAVVGAGVMGAAHAAVVAADPRARLVGVASVPDTAAREVARRHGAELATDDYRTLLRRTDVDLVIVATPDHLHTPIAVEAALAGKAILVEKPLATSLADADEVIAAVERSGVAAMTSFNHRWIPSYAQAKAAIEAGRIGRPRMAYARKNDRIHVPTRMLSWAADTTPAWFLSSHDIDLVCWFFGEDRAVEVYATAVRGVLDGHGVHTPDAIQAQVRFASGAVATFESCWTYPDTYPTMTDSFVEVVGEHGVVHLDRKDDQVEVATPTEFEYPRISIMPVLHGVPAGALAHAVGHMVGCVADGTPPLVSLAESRRVTAILAAVHESVAGGGPVPVAS
ncbi:Gfo/Idh/MocA family protein [Actinopolymorpha rutila]|uniref:Putative dehydrogenase n=1 Tax=Actinopolymorpha rutila TaxID=446787 RepID=A0A852ZMC4_9ACTN|nr:Gfo/Idh/MocA family oxidoreductase [Actinopolymorpha rutila]NYH89586.1 putative dehydrogenase [Actinopolymorpha rutila]